MSITKKLVEALEGTISVSSEVGSWTTFTVELPLRVSSHPDITEVHAVKEASRTLDLKELKVLIAEDNQVRSCTDSPACMMSGDFFFAWPNLLLSFFVYRSIKKSLFES